MEHRLLVVDDEPAILMALREFFKHRGYRVDSVHGRQEAEDLLTRERYACVIADLHLSADCPDGGLRLLEIVRQHHPETRFVILTAHPSTNAELEARRRGVDAFLWKPKPLFELALLVASLVGEKP